MSGEPLFATYAPHFRDKGFWPRPVMPGTRACKIDGWQEDLSNTQLQELIRKFPRHGIGLVMGSPFPDGTFLGAFDIDQDGYVPLAKALLRNPVCGRFGSKGAAFFVRMRGRATNKPLNLKGVRIADCLMQRAFCVIPPTVHPTTGKPYTWLGPSLLDIDFRDLPLVEAD